MKSHGFTVVELMIVDAIIGILAAVGVPTYNGYINDAAHAEANMILPDIISKENAYFKTWGTYIDAKDGFTETLKFGNRSPQVSSASGVSDWTRLGYSPKGGAEANGGIFGSPTYFRYAFDGASRTACARRIKPTLSKTPIYEFATLSVNNQRAIVFTDSGSDIKVCPRS